MEVIARSELKPILTRDRAVIAQDVQELIQSTLETYEAGVNIVRVNFDGADPPREVIDSFRDVQAAEQDRDTEEKRAEAYVAGNGEHIVEPKHLAELMARRFGDKPPTLR